MFLSLCFFLVLAVMPGPFFLRGNVYRQFPLYCFLEDEATDIPQSEDPETYEKIIESNAHYLGKKAQEENHLQQEEKLLAQAAKEQEGAEKTTCDYSEVEEKGKKEDKPQDQQAEDNSTEDKQTADDGEKNRQSGDKAAKDGKRGEDLRAVAAAIEPHPSVDLSPESLADFEYLLGQFFILDPTTATTADQLNAARFLGQDLTMKQDSSAPQILIYHSHSQETFADSREGEPEDTVVGVGNYLTQLLTDTYGYNVIHVTETFDIIDGEIDRSRAYDYAREYIEQVLAENPSVEVIIDLHRDGVPEDRHLVTEINGKDTAQIMFYNGLSYTVSQGAVEYLPNPYIQDNLAFSFQLEYQAAQYYPDIYRGIYLAGLRYNLHLRPKALLLEAGAQTNTVQEVKNAMEPFADMLDRVLKGGDKPR